MRYRLLEPIRQYAHELLDAADEPAAERARHADYFIELGEQAEPHLYGGRTFASWLDRLQPERSNLRSALRWRAEHGDAERGVRLGGAIWRWWFELSTPQECREWLDQMDASKPNGGGTSGVLSPREREVAFLVAHGLTNRRIADQLVISKRTADGHIASILGKLGLANRAVIAVWAVAHGLLADQLV